MKKDSFVMAGVMTAKAVAGISSIQVIGQGSGEVIGRIFKGQPRKFGGGEDTMKRDSSFHCVPFRMTMVVGAIGHGNICDGEQIIDEVIIGREAENSYSINCHGNPIIVENILDLLKKYDVKIVEAEEIVEYLAKEKFGSNIIAIEAETAATKAVTLDGAKIIQYQTKMGLLQTAQWLQKHIDVIHIEDIKIAVEQVLADSKIASYFINGAKVVLAGPPNSGKSTLFNYLCGKEKAIVADVAGTTRDWLNAKIRLKNIQAEIFDTAGLDEALSGKNIIDEQSQKRAAELAASADLVLYVVENRMQNLESRTQKNRIVVFNKCDLGGDVSADGFKVSAKTGDGVKELLGAIEASLGVADFDLKKTVCFTDRQRKILGKIAQSQDKNAIKELITELLNSD
jgi:tRNA modification GTPase